MPLAGCRVALSLRYPTALILIEAREWHASDADEPDFRRSPSPISFNLHH